MLCQKPLSGDSLVCQIPTPCPTSPIPSTGKTVIDALRNLYYSLITLKQFYPLKVDMCRKAL